MEISRARDRAELVTDDAAELRAQLQAVTGERIAALEGIGEMPRTARGSEKTPGDIAGSGAAKEGDGRASSPKDRELAVPDRGKGTGMDFGL